MKINICPICVVVGGTWFALSLGVVFGYLNLEQFIIPISILMGGSVVGVAYQGVQKFKWAGKHSLLWKFVVIFIGMPTIYFLISNLSKPVVIIESILLLIIAYFFFVERQKKPGGSGKGQKIRYIEEKMKQCC